MLRRSLLALLPAGCLLAACSGGGPSGSNGREPGRNDAAAGKDGSDADKTTGDPATQSARSNICATLDYRHDRTNDDYFLQFADDTAAVRYSQGFLTANGISGSAQVSRNDWLNGLVARLFGGFKTVFPRETAGMDKPPRILIVQEEGVNAFAGFDERKEYNKAPWLFWVHSGVLDGTTPEPQIEGLVAHELAHLVLRNMLPETRAKIRTYYRVPSGGEHGVFGAATPDDPAVRKHAGELRDLGALVGRASVFGPLPISSFEESEYDSMLQTLAKVSGQPGDSQACRTAQIGLVRAKDFYKKAVSVHDLTLDLTDDESKQVETFTKSVADALRKCYANVRISLYELKVRDRSTSEDAKAQMPRLLDPSTPEYKIAYPLLMRNDLEREIDSKSQGAATIERALAFVERAHQRITQLEADTSLPIDELRVFDMEEDADDAAVRVLRASGEDPRGITQLFLGQLDDGGACKRTIDNGDVPRYGRFIDVHNATCWRAFHTTDLAKALDSCPKSASTSRPSGSSSSSSPAISPADPSPMRLLQKRLRAGR